MHKSHGGTAAVEHQGQGDFNSGGVNATPWSIRVNVTKPAGLFSDPYRGRTGFAALQHQHEGTNKIMAAAWRRSRGPCS